MIRRRLPLLVAALVFLAVLAGIGVVDYHTARDTQEDRINAWLSATAESLEDTLNSRLYLVWGLDAFVASNPDFTEEEFLNFAGALETRWSGIRSVQLAPGGVVTYLTQPARNMDARGHNLLDDPVRQPIADHTVENRDYTVTGPVELLQGGETVAGKMPVYLPDRDTGHEKFWGFATIHLDFQVLLDGAGLLDENLPYTVALRGKHGLGEEGDVFFGDARLFETSSHQIKVTLPTGNWILAAQHQTSWPVAWPGQNQLWLSGFALAFAAGLIIYGLLLWPQRLKEAVRNATRALKSSREQYKQLTRVAPSGIYLCDADGNIIYANAQFRGIIGVKHGPITGDAWKQTVHHEDLKHFESNWAAALKSGVWQAEYRFRQPDGKLVWVMDRAHKVSVDENGRTLSMIGSLTDITELKQAQAELEDARKAADAANQTKSEFLASISHEIRTPLNGILGMVRVMQKTAPDTEVRSRLSIIEQSADTLLELLSEVLDYSQIEAGMLEISKAPFDAEGLMDGIAQLWRPRAEEKGLELRVDLKSFNGQPRVGDAKRMGQVISNLVSNAIKFTQAGSVTISARPFEDIDGHDLVEIVVADTGCGISVDDQKVIFDKFTRASRSPNEYNEGTGLGLAICKDFAELMGGGISVDSSPGQGAAFKVVLPCPVSQTPIDVPHHVEADPVRMPDEGESVRILVAEDNMINQQVIIAMLDRPGYLVDVVSNGEEAVERAAANVYDILLMDIRMPKLNGIEATRRIRTGDGPNADAPIIALTANTADSEWKTYEAAGMTDCITKPIDLNTLIEAIEDRVDGNRMSVNALTPVSAAGGATSS